MESASTKHHSRCNAVINSSILFATACICACVGGLLTLNRTPQKRRRAAALQDAGAQFTDTNPAHGYEIVDQLLPSKN